MKLEWNVYISDVNMRQIVTYNVFRHSGFSKDCHDAFKSYFREHVDDLDWLRTEIKHALMYWFWSKCEWEIILSDWPESDRFRKEKVDVYDQIMLNFPQFFNYLWRHKYEIAG